MCSRISSQNEWGSHHNFKVGKRSGMRGWVSPCEMGLWRPYLSQTQNKSNHCRRKFRWSWSISREKWRRYDVSNHNFTNVLSVVIFASPNWQIPWRLLGGFLKNNELMDSNNKQCAFFWGSASIFQTWSRFVTCCCAELEIGEGFQDTVVLTVRQSFVSADPELYTRFQPTVRLWCRI